MRPLAAHRRSNGLPALQATRLLGLGLLLFIFLAYRAYLQLKPHSATAHTPALAPHRRGPLALALTARVSKLHEAGLDRGDLRLAILRALDPAHEQAAGRAGSASTGLDAAVRDLLWHISLAQPGVECAWDASLPLQPLPERQGPQVRGAVHWQLSVSLVLNAERAFAQSLHESFTMSTCITMTMLVVQTQVLLAANVHNNEELLPHFILQLSHLLSVLPHGTAFLSVYESGSSDASGARQH